MPAAQRANAPTSKPLRSSSSSLSKRTTRTTPTTRPLALGPRHYRGLEESDGPSRLCDHGVENVVAPDVHAPVAAKAGRHPNIGADPRVASPVPGLSAGAAIAMAAARGLIPPLRAQWGSWSSSLKNARKLETESARP
jgi:hypothetical protein